ncbi:MAG: hypothetical protein ACJ8G2_12105 [Burkholderiales bacterium]|jgi:hypothetical protein
MIHVNCTTIAFLVISLASGCSMTHTVTVKPKLDALPVTTKSPVHAGIYYSPQFANQEYARKVGADTSVVKIGAASTRLFDVVLPGVFDKTARMTALSADEFRAHGVDVAIAPSLEYFDFGTAFDTDSDRFSVAYRLTLYNNQLAPLASWIVSGDKPSKAFSVGGTIEDDMTDAAVNLLNGFEANVLPALAAIEKSKTGKSFPVDLHDVVLTAQRASFPNLKPPQIEALQKAGVVTIEVTAKSQTERIVVVRASDMRLRFKDGQILEPSTFTSVLSTLEKTSQAGGVVAAATTPLIGLLVTAAEEQSKQAERVSQLKIGTKSLFGDRTLRTGNKETGIVFFDMPKDRQIKDEATLMVWVVDPSLAEGAQADVPLPMAQ